MLVNYEFSTGNKPPAVDQLEVSVFGPGFGEAILVHLGDGRWLSVDSCSDRHAGTSAQQAYLWSFGPNYVHSVDYMIASHWHADHIDHIADFYAAYPEARFVMTPAMKRNEFAAFLSAFNDRPMSNFNSGASELWSVAEQHVGRRKSPIYAKNDQRLFKSQTGDFSHNFPVEIWTLSPTDAQLTAFLKAIDMEMPTEQSGTKRRAPDVKPNFASVVVQILFGEISILLGADMECSTDPALGWSAILASQGRPLEKSRVFKVPHHGAASGHDQMVWDEMLDPAPVTVVAPNHRLAASIPTRSDLIRLSSLSSDVLLTHDGSTAKLRPGQRSVDRTLREMKANIRSAPIRPGRVTIREINGGNLGVELVPPGHRHASSRAA